MSVATPFTLTDKALRLASQGFSVVPTKADKLPIGTWKQNQNAIDDPTTLACRFANRNATGLAAICGKVSGGLLCFDFDLDKKHEALSPFDLEHEFVGPWLEAVGDVIDPHLIPKQRTGGGGFQFFVRCPNPPVNEKLAAVPANNRQGRHVVIETRGEGGYAIIPPSKHPSGTTYQWQHLGLDDVPMITQEQAEALLEAARALDQMPLEETKERRLTEQYHQQRSGNDIIRAFNAKYHPSELLERNGYRLIRGKYLSPDSTSGNPGVTVFKDAPLVYSHHGDLLGDGRAHDAFDVFALLEHGGDKRAAYEAAGRELRLWREGFTEHRGSPKESPWASQKTDFTNKSTQGTSNVWVGTKSTWGSSCR